MDGKKYHDAEMLFPEIELLQPENIAVAEWRKQIIAESEKIKAEQERKAAEVLKNKQAEKAFQEALGLQKDKRFYDALDRFDAILADGVPDEKIVDKIKAEIHKTEQMIADAREPFLKEAKEQESAGKLSEANRAYLKALAVDPMSDEGKEGVKRIAGVLTERAKFIYTEGVFAESYGDVDVAEKKFREVLTVVTPDNDYYEKASSRLKRLTVFKRAGTNVLEGIPE